MGRIIAGRIRLMFRFVKRLKNRGLFMINVRLVNWKSASWTPEEFINKIDGEVHDFVVERFTTLRWRGSASLGAWATR